MFSFCELLEDARNLGGVAARTAVSVAVPIPGAGIVLSPIASLYGEEIGKTVPVKTVPDSMRDSVSIYKSGGRKNTSLNPKDQIEIRSKYAAKAKDLGYNNIGQTVAAVDPGLLAISPDIAVKKNFF